MSDSLQLADVIQQLRADIAVAQIGGAGSAVQFLVSEVEVELLLELRRESGPQGKIYIGVAEIGGSSKSSTAATHRIKLKLEVTDAVTQRKVKIAETGDVPWPDGSRPAR